MKERMKPVQMEVTGETHTFHCKHKATWPPITALLDDPPEYLLAINQITEEEYARIGVWKRVCGLREMTDTKCLQCPNIQIELADGSLVDCYQNDSSSYKPFATQSRHARRGLPKRQKKKTK